MSDGRDVAYAAMGCGFGVWSFFHGFMRLRRKRLIENLPTSTVRGLAMGLVELSGKAAHTRRLVSPLTKTDCVFYRYTVERYESSGRSGHWVMVSNGDSDGCPFWLDDGTGTILVFPHGAELIMPVDYQFHTSLGCTLPDTLVAFLRDNGLSYGGLFGSHSFRFKEWFLVPDEAVYVLGTASNTSASADDPKEPEASGRVIIGQGPAGHVFIISDESQTQLLSSLSWQAFLGVWGGAALSLATLAYLLFRLRAWTGSD